MTKQQTHFGNKTVDAAEKASLVGGVFSSVAGKYDLMNDVMSGGLHRLWKNAFVAKVALGKTTRILDMAGGTGDIAFRLWQKAKEKGAPADITVSDINAEMLAQGRARALDRGIIEGIAFQQADAEALPFADNSFDYYTIAFGIRNVTHIDKALSEAYRVLKPGGRFLCLEFSQVENPVLARLYDGFSFHVIPVMGQAITKDREAYQYLVESIRKFPASAVFAEMITKAGFIKVSAEKLTKGVVCIHSGWKV